MNGSIPTLRKTNGVTQLWVNDKPFLGLGGELGNSTASDSAILDLALERCAKMHLNCIMLPVYWDLIEPTEGIFDFQLVQKALDSARKHKQKLVLLWFGTWKNSMSCYTPAWVKKDTSRFPRVQRKTGEQEEIVSPAGMNAHEADTRAFAELMGWLKQNDGKEQTVVMVQVENEVGMIPDARDHSPESALQYSAAVPDRLLALLAQENLGPEINAIWEHAGRHERGTWAQVFGTSPAGDEVFSAWQFATYVEHVAAAGKEKYPLPMFANAALIRPGYLPGQYPAAGPLLHLLEVWRAGAPSLDMICPDIYFPNFMEWCRNYVRNGNPLFIPEMAASFRAPGNAVYAVAHCNAMGFGPFAVESVSAEKENKIAQCNRLLAGMSTTILDAQQNGKIIGLCPEIGFDWSVQDDTAKQGLGGIIFHATFDKPNTGDTSTTVLPTLGSGRWDAPPGTPLGSAMIVQLSADEFVVLGMGVVITAAPADGKGKIGIQSVQEGHFDSDRTWVGRRWLNGDETHQGRHLHLYDGNWSIQRVTYYRY